ncbi:carbon monoxide dehydrogenase subunit G [Ramlibacter tataouinensis]|uniref:CoxG family protein n=1 Tax=Ramlibacter tataouinensis TaxID=94132 RepID=UPI0022F3AC38|nr:carbon monoxide dehydrogenase subunit G [Ramlibacter tataouinensis]WBY00243.1 carbon monoxide dehydrogenase subunit G [Ramlibacter tataouinensis]
MELTGEQRLPVTRERVWAALLDTDTLRAAIPGCEAVTHEGDGRYSVSVVAAVGPVKARFKGRLQQQDLQPPQRYTLSFEGDGGMAGFARGSAEVDLSEADGNSTVLAYRAQAQIGGRLAQIGSRLVDATAARMSQEFFERLTEVITAPPGSAQAARPAVGIPLSAGESPSPARQRGPALGSAPVEAPGWSGTVTIAMPGWAWAFTVAAAVACVWIAGT